MGDEAGGEINVFATDALALNGVENENNFISTISNQVFADATADGGDINIETGSLSLGDRAAIAISSSGQGNAGNVNIDASDSVSLESQGNTSAILSGIAADAVGNAGQIDINSNSLTLDNGASISSEVSGMGNAGIININANNLELSSNPNGTTFISSAVDGNGIGDAADININASNFNVQGIENRVVIASGHSNVNENNSSGNVNISADSFNSSNIVIFTTNSSQSNSGDVNIDASENINLNNGSLVFVQGTPGGSINIDAKNLSLNSGSNLFAGISAAENESTVDIQSGDIVINLSEDLIVNSNGNNEALTEIINSNFGQGNAGNIEISARNIDFFNGGRVSSSNGGAGNIGNISLEAFENITIDGIALLGDISPRSAISSFVAPGASGDVGEINITAQNLNLTNSGTIQSSVEGNANSGDINLNIADTILIDGFANRTNDSFGEEISQSINSGISTKPRPV